MALRALLCSALVLGGDALAKEVRGSRLTPAHDFDRQGLRGFTIGPIESRVQPGRGYGSSSFATTLDEIVRLRGNFVSLTVFGRVWDLHSHAVEPSFEAPFAEVRENVCRSVALAHDRGLSVLLVPHLWVESGGWRAELDPGTGARFEEWVKSYQRFVSLWADAAEECGVDLFATGVELRFWVTRGERAESFRRVIAEVRRRYHGPLTYAANWDDVSDTLILADLDVIGINAFYPLHWEKNASDEQLFAGGLRAAEEVATLRARYGRPVIFSEFGYTARQNTAIEPWLWPEQLGSVKMDQEAQATAYAALLSAVTLSPSFGGAFVWRLYADIADLSQEPDWGFSPWGKSSLDVLRDGYRLPFAIENQH